MKKGFTLVELLAVIVILAIILAIAIPSISDMINNSTKQAFESNAKMVLKAINYKILENNGFDPTTITEANIKTLLNIDDSNYKSLSVELINDKAYISIIGKNKWNNLMANGTNTNMKIDDGLVLWLDAGNTKSYSGTGTTWYDISGNNNNATIYGNNVWTSNNSGKFDFGDIDQMTNYISLNATAARATGDNYTIEFWMQPVSSAGRFFCSMSDGSNHNYVLFSQSAVNLTNSTFTGSNISYISNEILQYVVIKDGPGTGKVYKNGQYLRDLTNVTNINATVNNGWILNQEQDSVGGGFQAGQYYSGSFMIVKLYNKALDANEVKQNFEFYKDRYGL